MAYCLRDSFARPLNQHTYPVGSSENVSVRCWKDPMTVRCGRSRHRTPPQPSLGLFARSACCWISFCQTPTVIDVSIPLSTSCATTISGIRQYPICYAVSWITRLSGARLRDCSPGRVNNRLSEHTAGASTARAATTVLWLSALARSHIVVAAENEERTER